MTDILIGPNGEKMTVYAWVDSAGIDTPRERAVAAIGRDEDGQWFAVPFTAAGYKITPVQ